MFYQLTHFGISETIHSLLGRALAQNWRIMIRSDNKEHLIRLDEALWLSPEEGFIPHALEWRNPELNIDQPVLLGHGPIANSANGLMIIDGAEATLEEAKTLERIWVIFDSANKAQISQARAYWKTALSAGLPAQHWSDKGGGWRKEVESKASVNAAASKK